MNRIGTGGRFVEKEQTSQAIDGLLGTVDRPVVNNSVGCTPVPSVKDIEGIWSVYERDFLLHRTLQVSWCGKLNLMASGRWDSDLARTR